MSYEHCSWPLNHAKIRLWRSDRHWGLQRTKKGTGPSGDGPGIPQCKIQSATLLTLGDKVIRGALLIRNDTDVCHHAAVLVFENVAVVHEITYLRERDADIYRLHLAGA